MSYAKRVLAAENEVNGMGLRGKRFADVVHCANCRSRGADLQYGKTSNGPAKEPHELEV